MATSLIEMEVDLAVGPAAQLVLEQPLVDRTQLLNAQRAVIDKMAVVAGEPVVSPEMTGKLVAALQGRAAAPPPAPDALASLSARELQVLEEIARGASNKEIARTLDIAETTVKIHVQNILRKLGLSSRVQAAVAAREARPAGSFRQQV